MSPILMLLKLTSSINSCQTKNISSQYSKFAHLSCYDLVSEHFGKTCDSTGCKRLQNDGALNFVHFFLNHSV